MSRRRVCVVTSGLPAPGEPMAARAAEMHAAGAEVTLLRATAFPAETPLPLWQARLPFRLDSAFASDDPADAAFETWLWLRDAPPFDAIHFAAAGGAGYWLTVARRCGLAFPGTPLVCHLADAPTAAPLLHDLRQIERDFLERRSAEGADAVTGPGRPGWALPARRWRG
ncbi:MAG: hypothetical protein K2X11_02710, partial [Acetobacteraceae bacterium]|nr:hypothetical protein [Acetobacteraceae bacterium]